VLHGEHGLRGLDNDRDIEAWHRRRVLLYALGRAFDKLFELPVVVDHEVRVAHPENECFRHAVTPFWYDRIMLVDLLRYRKPMAMMKRARAMLAKLGPPTEDEQIAIVKAFAMQRLPYPTDKRGNIVRPFRSVHHTATPAAVAGALELGAHGAVLLDDVHLSQWLPQYLVRIVDRKGEREYDPALVLFSLPEGEPVPPVLAEFLSRVEANNGSYSFVGDCRAGPIWWIEWITDEDVEGYDDEVPWEEIEQDLAADPDFRMFMGVWAVHPTEDYQVDYYRTRSPSGVPIIVIQHSGIEHVWAAGDVDLEREEQLAAEAGFWYLV